MWGFGNVYLTNTDREWLDAFSFKAINRQAGGYLLTFPPAPIFCPALPSYPLTHTRRYKIYIYKYINTYIKNLLKRFFIIYMGEKVYINCT